MSVFREKIQISTDGFCGIHNITEEVAEILATSGINQGICCVAAIGSTAAISTIEYEPGLLKDIPEFFEKIIPSDIAYVHDKTWGDGNGFSHLRSFLIKTSLSIPFDNGKLDLGTWQQIIFLNFDNKSRSRELTVQLVGE